ncbi:hypothetical protein ACFWU5_07095 [Nocardia sp. NPDC058640]|uniref:hypothetical protein n=1 Tax=Nocardia sp. NPDC058640 TaxID=3346571 RepID=UPI0036544287
MKGQTSTSRLLTIFGGVAIVMLLVNWSLMRAVAFAVIWAIAAAVLVLRDRRRGAPEPTESDTGER